MSDNVSKRDIFHMSASQAQAGREMWKKTEQHGRLTQSSFNAEEMAPKTWILYANQKGEEIRTIECELYVVGRASDTSEAIMMAVAMCPKCHQHVHVREDNKTMHLDAVSYRKAPVHIKVNWRYHCQTVLGRPVSDSDLIQVISSPETWTCDYCKRWRVKVYNGIAKDDHSKGVGTIYVHARASEGRSIEL